MKVRGNLRITGVKIPHRFIADWMEFEGLTWYQDMILYIMFKVSVFFWIACRGISKSYMIAWFLVSYCILFPRSRFVIASGKFVPPLYGNI